MALVDQNVVDPELALMGLRARVAGGLMGLNPNDPDYLQKLERMGSASHLMGSAADRMAAARTQPTAKQPAEASPKQAAPEPAQPESAALVGQPTTAAPAPVTMGAQPQMGQHRGFLGKLGHGLARAADVAGSVFAPEAMAFIPGTTIYKNLTAERQAGQELAREKIHEPEVVEAQKEAFGTEHPKPLTLSQQEGAAVTQPELRPGVEAVEQARHPAKPKSQKAEWFMGPNGEAAQGYAQGKDLFLASGEPLPPGYKPYSGKTTTEKPVPGSVGNQPAWAIYKPGQGWFHTKDEGGGPFHGFHPPPTWAEVMPATHTITLTDPTNNEPVVYQYNTKTGSYDRVAGVAGTGTYAHQMQQAGASQRMIDTVSQHLRNVPVGTVQAWAKSYLLGTPIADPQLAGMDAQLLSVAALQPALHQFRSRNAMQAFEKIVGGLAKNPDATIASLQGLRMTAEAINPNLPSAPGGGKQAPTGATHVVTIDGVKYYTDGKKNLGRVE